MLAKLRRQRYGRSSEKLDAEIDQLELILEDAEAAHAQVEAMVCDQGPGRPRPPVRPPFDGTEPALPAGATGRALLE